MPIVTDNSICLPLSENVSNRCCRFEVTNFSSIRIQLIHPCSSYRKSTCTGSLHNGYICAPIQGKTVILPHSIQIITKAYDNKEYYVYTNMGETACIMNIAEDQCAVCGRSEGYGNTLIPILSKFLCERCYEIARTYLLFVAG